MEGSKEQQSPAILAGDLVRHFEDSLNCHKFCTSSVAVITKQRIELVVLALYPYSRSLQVPT